MKRRAVVWMLIGLPIVTLLVWIGQNTEWEDVKVPMPLTGEARTNPFYVVQRFAGTLGARTSWDRYFLSPPSPDALIVLANWHWTLSTRRRDALEHWVEAGGRLVVDGTLIGDDEEFVRWSGVSHEYPENPKLGDDAADDAHADADTDTEEAEEAEAGDTLSGQDDADLDTSTCRKFIEEENGVATRTSPSQGAGYVLCGFNTWSFLASTTTPQWALREPTGIKAMRVAVGRGSVTVINAAPFKDRDLFSADHGRLFVAATQLRRGDDVHFLSEAEHPSLLTIVWQQGGPVVALSFALIGLLLWRGGVRFGPLEAPPHFARRSLAEQIRGTGQFALRHGSGAALHTACVRALDEAAQRRINGYSQLSPRERIDALARLVALDRHALWTAVHEANPESRSPQDLRRMLALLERARRKTIIVRK